jgi:hypothetical protein
VLCHRLFIALPPWPAFFPFSVFLFQNKNNAIALTKVNSFDYIEQKLIYRTALFTPTAPSPNRGNAKARRSSRAFAFH